MALALRITPSTSCSSTVTIHGAVRYRSGRASCAGWSMRRPANASSMSITEGRSARQGSRDRPKGACRNGSAYRAGDNRDWLKTACFTRPVSRKLGMSDRGTPGGRGARRQITASGNASVRFRGKGLAGRTSFLARLRPGYIHRQRSEPNRSHHRYRRSATSGRVCCRRPRDARHL